MPRSRLAGFACAVALLSGCAKLPPASYQTPPVEAPANEPITTSLFPSDQAVLSDEAVARILSSKLELPARAKLAVMKFPDSYGRFYWRDEDHLKLQQTQIDTLSQALQASPRIAGVTALPSLMTPSRISIPILREAAVRIQADLLLIFRVGSDTYSRNRTFSKDKVKAYSTCELVLLDVRTGLVPFARVISRERIEIRPSSDLDLSETMRRAEQLSAADALRSGAEDLVLFVKSMAGE